MHTIYRAVYMGKEYVAFAVRDGMVTLRSEDRADLDNGFYINRSLEKYGFDIEKLLEKEGFHCIKRVNTTELSSLIETTFHYIYKGVELSWAGCRRDENGKQMYRLSYHFVTNMPENDADLKETYESYLADGFEKESEKAGCWMNKYIYEDDPNLEIIEEVKKLV